MVRHFRQPSSTSAYADHTSSRFPPRATAPRVLPESPRRLAPTGSSTMTTVANVLTVGSIPNVATPISLRRPAGTPKLALATPLHLRYEPSPRSYNDFPTCSLKSRRRIHPGQFLLVDQPQYQARGGLELIGDWRAIVAMASAKEIDSLQANIAKLVGSLQGISASTGDRGDRKCRPPSENDSVERRSRRRKRQRKNPPPHSRSRSVGRSGVWADGSAVAPVGVGLDRSGAGKYAAAYRSRGTATPIGSGWLDPWRHNFPEPPHFTGHATKPA